MCGLNFLIAYKIGTGARQFDASRAMVRTRRPMSHLCVQPFVGDGPIAGFDNNAIRA